MASQRSPSRSPGLVEHSASLSPTSQYFTSFFNALNGSPDAQRGRSQPITEPDLARPARSPGGIGPAAVPLESRPLSTSTLRPEPSRAPPNYLAFLASLTDDANSPSHGDPTPNSQHSQEDMLRLPYYLPPVQPYYADPETALTRRRHAASAPPSRPRPRTRLRRGLSGRVDHAASGAPSEAGVETCPSRGAADPAAMVESPPFDNNRHDDFVDGVPEEEAPVDIEAESHMQLTLHDLNNRSEEDFMPSFSSTTESDTLTDVISNDCLDLLHLLQSRALAAAKLAINQYVLPGYAGDRSHRSIKRSMIGYYHTNLFPSREERAVDGHEASCSCPCFGRIGTCVHSMLVLQHRTALADLLPHVGARPEIPPPVACVTSSDERATRVFSVGDGGVGVSRVRSAKRTIVYRLRQRNRWRCIRCRTEQDLGRLQRLRRPACAHVQACLEWSRERERTMRDRRGNRWTTWRARAATKHQTLPRMKRLTKIVKDANWLERTKGGWKGTLSWLTRQRSSSSMVDDTLWLTWQCSSHVLIGTYLANIWAKAAQRPISSRARPAPKWLRLPGDACPLVPSFEHQWPPDLLRPRPGEEMRCSRDTCQQSARLGAGPLHPEMRECWILSLVRPYRSQILIQRCGCSFGHQGRPMLQGPDLAEYSLFNWNNDFIFSHELLDHFTSRLNSGFTTFSGFVTDMTRTYSAVTTRFNFVSSPTFRRVWNAYVMRQELASNLRCPVCMPDAASVPDVVVVDAVTTSFHRKHLSGTLEPPTTIQPGCEQRMVRHFTDQQMISNRAARKSLRRALECWSQTTATLDSDKQVQFFEALDQFIGSDRDGHDCIGRLLRRMLECMENEEDRQHQEIRSAGLALLRQVAASESVLQLAPRSSWAMLRRLATQEPADGIVPIDTETDMSELAAHIPALGRACRAFKRAGHEIPDALRQLAQQLRVRAVYTLSSLRQLEDGRDLNSTILDVTVSARAENWTITGCEYVYPALRCRPSYPHLECGDAANAALREAEEDDRSDGLCRKFYDTYGKRRLTGGVLALWCTHGICVGWHIIPKAEGRNDVFSALFTRFPKPPRYVIYDFACQLAPYCLTREPSYFADTTFLIDEMHAHDHTKCSPACFLESYMGEHPILLGLKSSIAECGNAGLRRISKSVSYSSQDQAIILIRTFLMIWNRLAVRGDRSSRMRQVTAELERMRRAQARRQL